MIDFAGYDMPLHYVGVRAEHTAVRERAGVFDLSHMGEVHVSGRDAARCMQQLVAGDIERLKPGQAQYAVMCNAAGGIVDDVIVYREKSGFMVVINAACRGKDIAWMTANSDGDVIFRDDSDALALIAVQGPRALSIVQPFTDVPLVDLQPFHFMDGSVAGMNARISRTGYTGEDGLELYVGAGDAPTLWDTLIAGGRGAGLQMVGLAARDTLRLEAGLRLYGQDMDESIDPFSCGLGWTVRRSEGFLGAAALAALDRLRPPRRFVGLSLRGRAIARHGHAVQAGGRGVGAVTSGGFGFTLGHSIATAYLEPSALPGELTIEIRGEQVPAMITALPFYRRPPATQLKGTT